MKELTIVVIVIIATDRITAGAAPAAWCWLHPTSPQVSFPVGDPGPFYMVPRAQASLPQETSRSVQPLLRDSRSRRTHRQTHRDHATLSACSNRPRRYGVGLCGLLISAALDEGHRRWKEKGDDCVCGGLWSASVAHAADVCVLKHGTSLWMNSAINPPARHASLVPVDQSRLRLCSRMRY